MASRDDISGASNTPSNCYGDTEVAMPGSYIVAGARTPIGKMSGALSDFSAADLGGFAIAEALWLVSLQPHEIRK